MIHPTPSTQKNRTSNSITVACKEPQGVSVMNAQQTVSRSLINKPERFSLPKNTNRENTKSSSMANHDTLKNNTSTVTSIANRSKHSLPILETDATNVEASIFQLSYYTQNGKTRYRGLDATPTVGLVSWPMDQSGSDQELPRYTPDDPRIIGDFLCKTLIDNTETNLVASLYVDAPQVAVKSRHHDTSLYASLSTNTNPSRPPFGGDSTLNMPIFIQQVCLDGGNHRGCHCETNLRNK